MKKIFCLIYFFFMLLLPTTIYSKSYILIDKGKKCLYIKEKNHILSVYEIGLGIKSPIPKEKKGDFLTPEGIYHIVSIRPSQRYFYFIELDYPNINDIAWAYYNGLIDKKVFCEYLIHKRKNIKIYNTLGYGIGIHGGGAFKYIIKNGKIFKDYHWTQGCIALSNKDILEVLKNSYIKEPVFILNSENSLYEILKKFVYPIEIKPLKYFKGELRFKINDSIYYRFILQEFWSGKRVLIFQRWENGTPKMEIKSDINGKFKRPFHSLEKFLKNILINTSYLIERTIYKNQLCN
ncbi:MAG: hypothetical protein DRP29_10360 [Thermodesulfobacteriota bacterium]|nr:MAG: hypothetical protein DRP29_10360 [Thermodesulfobacteriota bacterium]